MALAIEIAVWIVGGLSALGYGLMMNDALKPPKPPRSFPPLPPR